jgi:hypothetical protein
MQSTVLSIRVGGLTLDPVFRGTPLLKTFPGPFWLLNICSLSASMTDRDRQSLSLFDNSIRAIAPVIPVVAICPTRSSAVNMRAQQRAIPTHLARLAAPVDAQNPVEEF